jgi:hypothetical protein
VQIETFFRLQQLQQTMPPPPLEGVDVDVRFREQYLCHDEFYDVFAMGKQAFGVLPLWKKNKLKRQVGLF